MAENAERLNIIDIPEEAYDDYKELIEHADLLPKICENASKARPTSNPEKIAFYITKELNLSKETSLSIVSTLLNLQSIRMRAKLEIDDFMNQLKLNYERIMNESDSKETIEKWEKASAALKAAVCDESPFAVLEKSINLAFAHQNVLSNMRLITDIRPVFNDNATKIRRMIVTHLLMLEYYDGPIKKRLHLALDAEDIENMGILSERAQKKDDVVASSFVNETWTTLVIGGEEDELNS